MTRSITLALAAALVALSALAGAPEAEAATCSSRPTVSGLEAGGFARYNSQLTGHNHCSTIGVGASTSLEWFRCDNSAGTANCTSVQTGPTYTPDTSDIGKYLKLVESASDLVGPASNQVVTGRVKGRRPVAAFSTNAPEVKRHVTVTFNASASSDPDGQPLTYEWDLNGNGTYEANTGTTPAATKSFSTSGTKTIRLRVRDSDGDTASAGHTVIVKQPPRASFVFSPGSPLTGDLVTFTSTSRDPENDPLAYAWDLDDDGAYDDGNTPVVQHVYAKAATYTVGLRVTADGETSNTFASVDVDPKKPKKTRKRKLKLLRPFPKVAIGGFITGSGVRLTLLGVKAPRGSKVMVKCRGRGCPRRVSRRKVRRKSVVLRSFRRSFRAGTVIKVYVWKKNRIGKYTSFRIRRNRRPARRDRCLDPRKLRPTRCPR